MRGLSAYEGLGKLQPCLQVQGMLPPCFQGQGKLSLCRPCALILLLLPRLPTAWRTGALLAAASTAGWLNLYSPVAPGAAEPCWAQQHSGTHHGYPRLAFTSHGSFLALASGEHSFFVGFGWLLWVIKPN